MSIGLTPRYTPATEYDAVSPYAIMSPCSGGSYICREELKKQLEMLMVAAPNDDHTSAYLMVMVLLGND